MVIYCSSGDSQTFANGEIKISISLQRVVRLKARAREFLDRLHLRIIYTTNVRGILSKYIPRRNNLFFRIISVRSNNNYWGK